MRLDRDDYYMQLARETARRSTCPRRAVGAILVDTERDSLVASGYNGAPKGMPHCDLHGCELDAGGHCQGAVHAEINAVVQAAGGADGATLYVTTLPCRRCMSILINARVARIVYGADYADPTHSDNQTTWVVKAAECVGIELDNITV